MKKMKMCAMLLCGLMLTGCGAGEGMSSNSTAMPGIGMDGSASMDYGYDGIYEEDLAMPAEIPSDVKDNTVLNGRKLIRTVRMDVETKGHDYDGFLASVQAEVENIGGYVQNQDSYNGSIYSGYKRSRSTDFVLRVPKDKLDDFLGMVSEGANVINRSDNVEDITLSYVDLESRKNALETEQDSLLKLMERAETVEDIISIEGRLSDVRGRLDSMESQLRIMDNQIDYSTVYLSVSEVEELTPIEERNVFERIADGFVGSIRGISNGAVELFVWTVSNVLYLALGAGVVAGIVVIIKKLWRGRRLKKKISKEDK